MRRIRIFVASPGDVAAERQALEGVVADLNHTLGQTSDLFVELVRWETHAWPGFGQDAQDVINKQIAQYDVFLGLMWTRLGTPTGRAASGTVEEFARAYERWRLHGVPHLMLYFSRAHFRPDTSEAAAQFEAVQQFKHALNQLGAFYWEYTDVAEFSSDARRHLYRHLSEHAQQASRFQWRAQLRYAKGHRRVIVLSYPQGAFELDFKYSGLVATAKVNGIRVGRQLTLSGAQQGCAFPVRLGDERVVGARVMYTLFLPKATFPTFAVWLDDQCAYSEDNRIFKRGSPW
jgi:hypothetical protein